MQLTNCNNVNHENININYILIITHKFSDKVTIEGCWISKDDNHYSLKIRKNTLEEIYDTETSSFNYKKVIFPVTKII